MSSFDPSSDLPPSTLEELTSFRSVNPDWRVDLLPPKGGDRKLTESDLEAIARHPDAVGIRVMGLDQPMFERFVSRYGRQFTALHLWKCPRIEDLSPLEDLPGLSLVSIYWNQRATRLWNLAKTPDLRGLEFEDFTRLHDLDDLRRAGAIEELSFGDKVWAKAVVASLEPVGSLESLRRLSFAVRKVEDGRIQPLARLRRLEQMDCSTNLFTTEQLAWLRVHAPDTARGRVLEPIEKLNQALPNDGGSGRDVLVMGKRKPFLNSTVDADRIERYVMDYWNLVTRFRQDPSLEPRSA